jgi:hypothetical protein
MNLEKLKAQQAALQAHTSAQEQVTVLAKTLVEDGRPTLKAAIHKGFASLGLKAQVNGGFVFDGSRGFSQMRVEFPPSKRSVMVEMWEELEFDEEHLRSVFGRFGRIVPSQTPMALPIEITVSEYGSPSVKSSIWWHGPSDTERLTTIIVDMFKGKRGPNEVSSSSCFVATVVFGEHSEEVAILRKWRDECLSESIVGRALVKAYYGVGPFCAAVVQGNAVVRRLARSVLLAVCRRLSRRT